MFLMNIINIIDINGTKKMKITNIGIRIIIKIYMLISNLNISFPSQKK